MVLKNLVSTVYRKCFVLPCTHGEESVCSKQTLVFFQHEETGKINKAKCLHRGFYGLVGETGMSTSKQEGKQKGTDIC